MWTIVSPCRGALVLELLLELLLALLPEVFEQGLTLVHLSAQRKRIWEDKGHLRGYLWRAV